MRVVFMRHATRDVSSLPDEGLNQKGLTQAQELPRRLSPEGPFPLPTRLICSPKRRTRETLTPLAEHLGLTLEVRPELDERGSRESALAFEERVRAFLAELGRANPPEATIVLCSHLDWLEEAMAALPSDMLDDEAFLSFQPCEFRVFQVREEIWYTVKTAL